MNDRPFALHITWTTYGTWLPGDPRGYVSRTLTPTSEYLPKENLPQTPYRKDEPLTRSTARSRQKWPTVWLNQDQALIVAQTLIKSCQDRNWFIPQAAVMANHIHVIVMNCPPEGPAIRRILKGTTQAALSKKDGTTLTWWTTGGSDRYKNDDRAIEVAIVYVRNQEHMLMGIENMELYYPK